MSNNVKVKIVGNPKDAPDYSKDPEFKGAIVTECVIVGRGTEMGNPTVDIQFENADGQKYVAMLTGNLVETIGGMCAEARKTTRGH